MFWFKKGGKVVPETTNPKDSLSIFISGVKTRWENKGFVFKKTTEGKLAEKNLSRQLRTTEVDCVDERNNKDGMPRKGRKVAGATLGELVLESVKENRPLVQVMEECIRKGNPFYWHNGSHKDLGLGKTDCGFNDRLDDILVIYLTTAEKMSLAEAQAKTAFLLNHPTQGAMTAQARIDHISAYAEELPPAQLVCRVSSLEGGHTAESAVINGNPTMTLVHLNPEGERHFMVDPDNVEELDLALATFSVLFGISPDKTFDIFWLDS